MKINYRNLLWPALGLAIALSLLWEFVPLRDARARLDALPARGLLFASRDVPLSEVESGIYQRARTVKRLYQASGQMVMVLVIDGSLNRHAVHDPTFCFRGAGWAVAATHALAIPGGSANLVTLTKGNQTAEAMYWWSDGHSRHASTPRYWWQTTLRRLTFGKTGDEPVLVVVQPGSGGTVRWDALLDHLPILFEL